MKKIAESAKKSNGFTATLVDASNYLASHKIDLNDVPFTAIAVSFEKIFGFPNLGAAIISGDLIPKLIKPYFGGGTLVFAMPDDNYEKMRLKPSEKLEDGSIPFLSIASLKYGFKLLNDLDFDISSNYQHSMCQRLLKGLRGITHQNGKPGTVVYSPDSTENIVTFNVLDSNGNVLDYEPVINKAMENNITLAGGCMSTPSTCYSAMGVSNNEIKNKKIGAIRASVGWATTMPDVDKVIHFITNYVKQ